MIQHPASFRDPCGFVFMDPTGKLQRQINPIYFSQYKHLKESGLYSSLVKDRLLVEHQEVAKSAEAIVIQPELIDFISYPYEWSFPQLQDAALLTLEIQTRCIKYGMILKDASAYNVTFHRGRPIFIDSLSFDFYHRDRPWRAYGQFLSHFLAPLVLACYRGTEIIGILSHFIEGIPLKFAAEHLPFRARFNPFILTNIYIPALYEKRHSGSIKVEPSKPTLPLRSLNSIIENLAHGISCSSCKQSTEWGHYYSEINYTNRAFEHKGAVVSAWISKINAKRVWDVGGNDGTFARKLPSTVSEKLVTDIDSTAVGANYLHVKSRKECDTLPLISNILNPSPGIGFAGSERESFISRIKKFQPSAMLALALVHHLTLTGGVPFIRLAEHFAELSPYLIIEFPKPNDSWVATLLQGKREFRDHFLHYSETAFEEEFSRYYSITEKEAIIDSDRTLYLMKSKNFT